MATTLATKTTLSVLAAANGTPQDPSKLDPGFLRLYNYYKPSLEAGLYGIEATQIVGAPGESDLPPITNTIKSPGQPAQKYVQEFEVIAPQFSIDADKINSFYPPQGHSDEGRILPHVVFNDPHLPWLRWPTEDQNHPTPGQPSGDPNIVPWMALVVFDPSDLILDDNDALQLGLTDSHGTAIVPSYNSKSPPANGAFQMPAALYLSAINSRVKYEVEAEWPNTRQDQTMTNVIFPKKDLIKSQSGDATTATGPLQRFKYLSHVRQVNTVGFPDAGFVEEGLYSVCVSGRTGNFKTQNPVTQIVHLVSIEHLDQPYVNPNSPSHESTADRVGLISLFNWTYTVIPEDPSFTLSMENLANAVQTLRPPENLMSQLKTTIDNTTDPKDKARRLVLYERLNDGYTLSRWRSQTGEVTTALNRGPLTPNHCVAHPKDPTAPQDDPWPGCSMHGKDLQIYDSECGLMNLTYSNAWNLGRLASTSDGPFSAAILRFRNAIWNTAGSRTRNELNNMTSKSATLNHISSLISSAYILTDPDRSTIPQRVAASSTQPVSASLASAAASEKFASQIRAAVSEGTASVVAAGESAGTAIWGGIAQDQAANEDWATMFNWVQQALFLAKLPAHYVFPEPSFIAGQPRVDLPPGMPALPPEALRFFHIDDTWMDSFIDGALSVANHLQPAFDQTRACIKEVFNAFFDSEIANTTLKPIIPRSGFMIRSAIIKAVPDLRITATRGKWDNNAWVEDPDTHHPVCRLTRLDEFSILCLFDCLLAQVWKVRVAQPAHQQRFAIGSALDPAQGVVEFKGLTLYSNGSHTGPWPGFSLIPVQGQEPLKPLTYVDGSLPSYIDVNSRCVNAEIIANDLRDYIFKTAGGDYTQHASTSAELGLELNDPAYSLDIWPPGESVPLSQPVLASRKLWISAAEDAIAKGLKPMPSIRASNVAKPGPVKRLATRVSVAPPVATIPAVSMGPKGQPPKANVARVIAEPRVNVNAVAGPGAAGPQFQALVCVDTNVSPQMPMVDNSGTYFGAADHIPTGTGELLDLIVVLQRKQPQNTVDLDLERLEIEIPVSDGHGDNTGGRGSNVKREPLLVHDNYDGQVWMEKNQRFVPILYRNDSGTNTAAILGIRLQPRSGKADTTIAMNGYGWQGPLGDVSFRLTRCNIASIESSHMVLIPTAPNTRPTRLLGGLVNVTLREYYSGNLVVSSNILVLKAPPAGK